MTVHFLRRMFSSNSSQVIGRMIWAALAFILVAVTKYLTALRLRALRDRLQGDEHQAGELRAELQQIREKEVLLQTQAETLTAKVAALSNVIQALERSLTRGSSLPMEEGAGE